MVGLPNFNSALSELLKNNLPFHTVMENEIGELPYGTITFNFDICEGRVVLGTVNIVRNRRIRY